MNLSGSQVYTGWNPQKECFEIRLIKRCETVVIEVDNINRLELFIGQLECLKMMLEARNKK